MFNKNKVQKSAAQNGFTDGMKITASALAIGATFFGTGPAYSATIQTVRVFSSSHYGPGIEPLVDIGWFLIVAGSIYGLSKASIYTWIVSISLILAARLI